MMHGETEARSYTVSEDAAMKPGAASLASVADATRGHDTLAEAKEL